MISSFSHQHGSSIYRSSNNWTTVGQTKKKKLYSAFIDFKQAFHTVWREGLWKKLKDYHINGKCHTLIKNMYNNIKSKISTYNDTTEYFPCTIGVRQGVNLSPFLFSIYLNDLEHYLNNHQVAGIICEAEDKQLRTYLKLFILLSAHDTVLLSKNKTYLQNALNIFKTYWEEWKLTINIEKTKVLVFRRGKHPKMKLPSTKTNH